MKNIKYLGTLLLLAMAWACSNDNEIVKPESVQPVSDGITFTATFGVKNGTSRALSDPGDGTLTASWQQGEEIAIVFGDDKYTATVTEVDADGSATVTATLPAGTPNNQPVIYIYPASAADGNGLRGDVLSSQDGTLATLSSTLDIATANGTLVVDGNKAQPNGTVTFENQFAICKLQFKDESDQAINDIKKVTITDLSTTEVITVTTPSAQPAVYVAMKPSNNSMKFLVTRSNGDAYEKTSNAHMQAGMFYQPTFTTTFAASAIPLTFEAINSGTISFANRVSGSVYYSIDGGERVEIAAGSTGTTPTLTAGQKVCFYGDNSTYSDGGTKTPFSFSGNCYIYGNIMSLISSTSFADLTVLTGNSGRNFENLFKYCTRLKNHPTKKLVLPATTLQQLCYNYMFANCSGLTEAPDLPATTIPYGCYWGMFDGCNNLTKAPDLPATAPGRWSYRDMFKNCSRLNSVKCLATDLSVSNCTETWLNGVPSTGTFTKKAGVTWPTGASGIPDGWTVVEE